MSCQELQIFEDLNLPNYATANYKLALVKLCFLGIMGEVFGSESNVCRVMYEYIDNLCSKCKLAQYQPYPLALCDRTVHYFVVEIFQEKCCDCVIRQLANGQLDVCLKNTNSTNSSYRLFIVLAPEIKVYSLHIKDEEKNQQLAHALTTFMK